MKCINIPDNFFTMQIKCDKPNNPFSCIYLRLIPKKMSYSIQNISQSKPIGLYNSYAKYNSLRKQKKGALYTATTQLSIYFT